MKLGNFDSSYITTVGKLEGYYDHYNTSTAVIKSSAELVRNRKLGYAVDGSKIVYELIFLPCDGFLFDNQPLAPNTELKLSFDRAKALVALQEIDTPTSVIENVIELKDTYAVATYISSDNIRKYFGQIERSPINYIYDDVAIMVKSLPLNETKIRFHNIKGGNIPSIMALGIIKTSALQGSLDDSSTAFQLHDVQQVSISLNGTVVDGYPLKIQNSYPISAYKKFLDVTQRYYNINSSAQLSMNEFVTNLMYWHDFEGSESNSGWISVTLDLTKPVQSTAYSLGNELNLFCIPPQHNILF